MADGQRAIELLQQTYPEDVLSTGSYRDQHWVEVKAESLVKIATWLRDETETSFDFLLDVTAVHWPEDPRPIEIVYHLFSYRHKDRLRLKTRTGEYGPVPTLSAVWRSAAWNERETYDMFGIRFEDHPDLRRILMPDDYTEFPLRKELPLYRG